MNRELKLAIEFAKAPKELQEAALAAYDAEKAYDDNIAEQARLAAQNTPLLQASNDAEAAYKKILKSWTDANIKEAAAQVRK